MKDSMYILLSAVIFLALFTFQARRIRQLKSELVSTQLSLVECQRGREEDAKNLHKLANAVINCFDSGRYQKEIQRPQNRGIFKRGKMYAD